MRITHQLAIFATLALSTVAVAQNSPVDGAYQVRYATNLQTAGFDSAIDVTNTGANNALEICVNTYVFSPDEQLVSCCSCKVSRNALYSGAVKRDLLSTTLTPGVEDSVVIKLVATAAGAGSCNPANPGATVQGMAAWGTTLHFGNLAKNATVGAAAPSDFLGAAPNFGYATETPFTNSSLSTAELSVMTTFCGFIQANGSGYGVCKFCQGNGANSGLGSQNTGTLGLGPNVNGTYRTGLGADQQ